MLAVPFTQQISMGELRPELEDLQEPQRKNTATINRLKGSITIRGSLKQNGWPRTADIDSVLMAGQLHKVSIREKNVNPDQDIEADCTRKLNFLPETRENLAEMIELIQGARSLMAQSWTTLLIYTDCCAPDPTNEQLFT